MYEIEYTVDGVKSWMYFTPRKDAKTEGEKKFRQVCRDSGWKKVKLVKIRPLPKAVDPPLTKAQKDALRQGTRSNSTTDTRRKRRSGTDKPEPRKVSGTRRRASTSRSLESTPTRKKVSKDKLPKAPTRSRKSNTRKVK